MPLLSSPFSVLAPRYDVIIIGSGYGGSITASLLARTRRSDGTRPSVCLLERGKEIPVGCFPDTLKRAMAELQVTAPRGQAGERDSLYWLHKGEHLSVFHGCGLGGTSLVSANVVLPPDPGVWADERWPRALQADVDGSIAASMERVRMVLAATPYPGRRPALPKAAALRACAEHLAQKHEHESRFHRPELAVTFESREHNDHGIEQPPCTGCGDCVSGCNVGSKNTLMMNYLPDARNHGARIFCRVDVRRILRSGDEWVIYLEPLESDRDAFGGPEMFVKAGVVVLAAGALGSSEIMLRSRATGLPCSDRVGASFSANGDALGFAYDADPEIRGIGMGMRRVDPDAPPGPCTTSIIDRRTGTRQDYVIEEGTMPGAVARVVPQVMAMVASLTGDDNDEGIWDEIQERARRLATALPGGAYRGAMQHTQTFLAISHDGADGRITLRDDRVAIDGSSPQPAARSALVEKQMSRAAEGIGGTHVPYSRLGRAFGHDRVTLHPLGGCAMAEQAERGVVDDQGRVFRSARGAEVYDSLLVSDGSIIPTSLGINPLLTIAAIADRNARLLAARHGWLIDTTPHHGPARYDGRTDPVAGSTLHFTERMVGRCSPPLADGGEPDAAASGEICELVITVHIDALEATLEDPATPARCFGTVSMWGLSAQAMTISDGHFALLVPDTGEPGVRRMWYRMQLHSLEGETFYFEGFKVIRDDPGVDVWRDSTTLYATIHRGEDTRGPRVAQGVLRVGKRDFMRQLRTMTATGPDGQPDHGAVARFGKLFARELWTVYGMTG